MTTVVVLADDPTSPAPLEPFVPDVLSTDEAAALSRAMLADVCEVVQTGQADLLVNYPERDDDSVDADTTETALQEFLGGELRDPDAVRYEPQVGSSRAARVGNALTHLLEEEGEDSVAVAASTAPLLRREHIGSVAMKLRTSEVVLGPAPGGRITLAAFREPVDFADIYASPALATFARRSVEANLDVEFLPMTALLETPADLQTVMPVLDARLAADRLVPPRTTARLEELGVEADEHVPRSDKA